MLNSCLPSPPHPITKKMNRIIDRHLNLPHRQLSHFFLRLHQFLTLYICAPALVIWEGNSQFMPFLNWQLIFISCHWFPHWNLGFVKKKWWKLEIDYFLCIFRILKKQKIWWTITVNHETIAEFLPPLPMNKKIEKNYWLSLATSTFSELSYFFLTLHQFLIL